MDGFSHFFKTLVRGLVCTSLLVFGGCAVGSKSASAPQNPSAVSSSGGTSAASGGLATRRNSRIAKAVMYCWEPAEIQETQGKTVAVAQISGPSGIATAINNAFMEFRPDVAARLPRILDQEDLQRYSTIRLAAGHSEDSMNRPSDMALAHAAKRQQVDYLLSADVLETRGAFKSGQAISVSWRLLDVENNTLLGGRPVTVTPELLTLEYPDLATGSNQETAMIEAVARAGWRLISPHIKPHEVELASTRWIRGSKRIQAGNEYAMLGNWYAAEQIWTEVLRDYPHQYAAMHNLALAYAARQDFVTAKKLAQQALQKRDSEHYRRTTVWIELRQIGFGKAFDLPPPSEGWLFSSDRRSAVSASGD